MIEVADKLCMMTNTGEDVFGIIPSFPFSLFNDHFPGSQNNERSISASDFPATTV
jgi:hypothetical protein